MEDKKDKSASLSALEEAQKAFEGFAKENALENVDDVIKMVKDIRKNKNQILLITNIPQIISMNIVVIP